MAREAGGGCKVALFFVALVAAKSLQRPKAKELREEKGEKKG